MDPVIIPSAVKVTFLVTAPKHVKPTGPEVKEVVAEVNRAVNIWLYSGQSDWLFS